MTDQQQPSTIVAAPPAPTEPAAARKTNVLAIVSLVSAFFVSLVAIICGHIALSQIKRRGESGRGLAIAGLIIGYLGLVATIVMLVVVFAVIIPAGTSAVSKAADCAKVETAGSTMMSSVSTAFSETSDSLEKAQSDITKATDTFKSATAKVDNSEVAAAVKTVDAKLDAMNAAFSEYVAASPEQRDTTALQNSANDVDSAWAELAKTCTTLTK
jgi:hypothetical protein